MGGCMPQNRQAALLRGRTRCLQCRLKNAINVSFIRCYITFSLLKASLQRKLEKQNQNCRKLPKNMSVRPNVFPTPPESWKLSSERCVGCQTSERYRKHKTAAFLKQFLQRFIQHTFWLYCAAAYWHLHFRRCDSDESWTHESSHVMNQTL